MWVAPSCAGPCIIAREWLRYAGLFAGTAVSLRFTFGLAFLILLALSTPALAGVGASSSGVTTSTGNSTDPSADVQSQSASFVQQNQQQAQNAATASGIAVPGSVSAQSGAPTGTSPDGSPAGGNSQQAQPAVPSEPPPPPPVYESTMRRLDRRSPEPPSMTVEASGPPGSERKPDAEPVVSAPPKATPPPPAPSAPLKSPPLAPRPSAPAESAPEHAIVPAPVTGGRGAAPDGFTLYSGLTIAGALLAFGFFTFMRIGRSEGSE
jgi:hypothetical protein